LLRTVLTLSFSCKPQRPADLLSSHGSHQPWEARRRRRRRRRMLAGGTAWQPACPAHPCLQPRRGCKLGKGSGMRTAICAPGAVPRPVWGIISPLLTRTISFPSARVELTQRAGNTSWKRLGRGLQGGKQGEGCQSHLQQPTSPVTCQPPGAARDPPRARDGPSVTGTAPFHAAPALLVYHQPSAALKSSP